MISNFSTWFYLVHVGKFGVSSLAVVGQMGVLLGNISITDVSTASATPEKPQCFINFTQKHQVKYVIKSKNSLLWNTCFQFVGFVRSKQGIDDGQVRDLCLR